MVSLVSNWLLNAPLWAIGAGLLAGMFLAAFAGWWVRQWHDRASAGTPAGKSQEDYIVSAVMGLLALLTGFTFSMAVDRYDTRRETVLLEANAIGTTYLRTQLLDPPHRARLSKLLIDYTDTRIVLAQEPPGPRQTQLLDRSNRMITDLWTATVAAFPSMKGYDFSSSYLEAMNNLIDMDAARQQSRHAHVPPEVFLVLIAYQLVAAGVMGYVLIGRRGRPAAGALLLLFGVTLVLMIDIDRPTGGGISEGQEPMLLLQASLKEQPPAIFDRFDVPPPPASAVRPLDRQ